mmetsp:Transcript_21667/g.52909  ORF Transcript_21667/g.52909 Transcript_21667/m.52909 type:complete len:165 (+) Transcript_21667:69-563(+)
MDDYDGLFADLGGMNVIPSADEPPTLANPSSADDDAAFPSASGPLEPETSGPVDGAAKSEEAGQLNKLVEQFRIMPLVRAILERIRDGAQPSEVKSAVVALDDKLGKCEEFLDALPGGALTLELQMSLLQKLNEKLERKRDLLKRYRDLPIMTLKTNVDPESAE